MKTEEQLNKEILDITLKINHQYPELSKYLSEMPVTIPNELSPEIEAKTLTDYLNSLNELLLSYIKNHQPNK